MICLRYHCSGFCFKDCKFTSGHGTLDGEEKSDLEAFLVKARDARKQFVNGRHPRTDRDPATTAALAPGTDNEAVTAAEGEPSRT